MTATVIDFRTRQHLTPTPTPTAPTVPCPTWCPGNCGDGLHERVLFRTRGPGNLDDQPLGLTLTLERDDTDLWPTEVLMQIGMAAVRLTRQQRIDLAAALLAANDLDDDVPGEVAR